MEGMAFGSRENDIKNRKPGSNRRKLLTHRLASARKVRYMAKMSIQLRSRL